MSPSSRAPTARDPGTLGLLVALVVSALWLLGRVRGGSAKGRRAARWAAPRDVRRLRVKGAEPAA